MATGMEGLTTDPKLAAAIERARNHVMTPAERHAQRRSWVVGEMSLEHPEMSREEIEALVDQVLGPRNENPATTGSRAGG